MTLTLDNFDLEAGTDVDVMEAVIYAAQLPFRAGVSKTMILLACSECTERKQRYSDVQRLLVNNDIHLHVLVHEILRLKSRSPKTAYIYGKSSLSALHNCNKTEIKELYKTCMTLQQIKRC